MIDDNKCCACKEPLFDHEIDFCVDCIDKSGLEDLLDLAIEGVNEIL